MNYRLQDLIDMEQFQSLQDRLNEIYSFPSAIIDNDGNILTATAWQDVCTKFHRLNPECEKECIKSDRYILDHIAEANPAVSYRCPHGLIDNATPIIIDGVHLGNFFTGQFFLEEPDLEYFRAQATKHGFDEEAYIEAVRNVPVWTQENLNSYLFFIKGLIEVISGIGLKNLRAIEARQRIEESEKQFEAMFETASIGIAQADPHTGKWVRVNQKMCEITGRGAEELLAMQVSDIAHPGDREREWEAFQQVVRGAAPDYRMETRYIRKDATVVWVNLNMTVIRDAAGQPVRTMATIEDISERKRADDALRESEVRYRTLFDRANDGIFLLSTDGKLVSLNDSLARMHGYSVDEMLDMSLKELDTPETARLIPGRMRRLLAGEALTFEVEHYHKDGHVFPLEVSASLITSGGESFIQCFHRDITERKQADKDKAKLQEQLAQAQKMESVGRLAGGVAHDFNNMLSVILGHGEMALEQLDPAHSLYTDLLEIRKAAQRSADLTRQLLAFARKQTVLPKRLDLNEAVAGMLKMLQRLMGEDIKLNWQAAENLWPVMVDPSQVDQILANLCVNARDAIPGVGQITIETGNETFDEDYCANNPGFVPGEYVLVAVSDSGCGMDKETLAHIFEPFFTTKELGKGTGLGLATVYGAVKQNRGFINIYSEPGQGTTFKIYLPRHRDTFAQLQDEGPARSLMGGQETILLVEDEPAILRMTTKMLENLGYTVLTAGAPGEAIRLAREFVGEIDLLMTDVVMPEMNGRELAKSLLSLYPNLKRLFMSGYTADVIAHHGVLEDGVNFIQKPFSTTDVAAKVREALTHEQ